MTSKSLMVTVTCDSAPHHRLSHRSAHNRTSQQNISGRRPATTSNKSGVRPGDHHQGTAMRQRVPECGALQSGSRCGQSNRTMLVWERATTATRNPSHALAAQPRRRRRPHPPPTGGEHAPLQPGEHERVSLKPARHDNPASIAFGPAHGLAVGYPSLRDHLYVSVRVPHTNAPRAMLSNRRMA